MGMTHAPNRSFRVDAAIGEFLRVVLSSGKLAVAGLADRDIGVTEYETFEANEMVAVRLPNAEGTCRAVAAKAITAGAEVFTAAAGKVSDASPATSIPWGIALSDAAGDGSVIEVLRHGGYPAETE